MMMMMMMMLASTFFHHQPHVFSGVFLVLRGVPEAPQLEVWTAAATSPRVERASIMGERNETTTKHKTAGEFFHEILLVVSIGILTMVYLDPNISLSSIIPEKNKTKQAKASFIAFFRCSVHPPKRGFQLTPG